MAILNGRRIDPSAIPESGVYGRDILRETSPEPGRRVVIEKGPTRFETVAPDRRYTKRELLDRKGNPVKIADIPDRTKGVGGLVAESNRR